jgi:two-component system NtrC family response regulator
MFWTGPGMRDLKAEIDCAVRCDLNVMITGENGLEKASLAHWIHRGSGRRTNPFVAAPSARDLGSVHALDGALRQAGPQGTIYINDGERLSPAVQARLLEYTPRDVRIIIAANSSLFDLVLVDDFHECLFYRLNTIHLMIPPLRDRPEDIPPLLRHFMSLDARGPVPRLSPAAWDMVMTYLWPGNIRELRSVAETLASRQLRRLLEPDDLPPDISH